MAVTTKYILDERIASLNRGLGKIADSWGSRALYLGESGARNWIGVVTDPGYPLHGDHGAPLRAARAEAVRSLQPATMVSLGPGDGLEDRELILPLQRNPDGSLARTQDLVYCPVDISCEILESALGNLKALVDVPISILCDFEEGQDFLEDALTGNVPPPILFTMLGGTVGNLDCGEENFFSGFRKILGKGDAFLLDVPLAGSGWTSSREPRLHHESYSESFRRFLLEGQRVSEGPVVQPSKDEANPDPDFEDRIDFTHWSDSRTGAEVVGVVDKSRGKTILTFRRFRWERILRWLEEHGFEIAFSKRTLRSADDSFGMGVVLIRST